MPADTRNTRIVVALIAAMTLGAQVLLLLETNTPGWSADRLLMAERREPIEELTIEFVPGDRAPDPGAYDCVVRADGATQWAPRGPAIRLAVLGSLDDALPAAQAIRLLEVVGHMSQARGLDLRRVRLHPDSDSRIREELPPQARELCAILVNKGIIR